MTTALHVLLNQRDQKRNCGRYLKLQGPSSGMVMLLVVLVIPIAFLGIKYSQTLLDRRQKILEVSTEITPIYRKYDPATVALIAAKNWNPAKTVANQDLNPIYEAAFDSGIWRHKSTLGGAVPGLISDNSGEEMAAAVPPFAPTTSAGKIEYAKKDIKFFVDNDRIRAKIVGKSGFALPAECNLDLVLAIPTNASAAVTEIGKASANFLKDNFYYTRGVYASVIPYSGKLSLPSDRYDGWTEAFPDFSKSGPFNGANWVSLYDLYGTSGNILTIYDSAGSKNGYSIMCRANLFDATNANVSKYKRMNITPCTSPGLSTVDDTVTSPIYTTYTANQPSIIEPTADLSTAYAKCNGLTLPSDTKNTSSFSFAALEWVNNMFQNWTNNPQISAVDGDNGILSNPSKITAGRKKAILLIVNKPDTFTAGELTYLGLSNDADENYVDMDWEETKLPSSLSWHSTCYGNGKFVATAWSNKGAWSSDGINWTQTAFPSARSWTSVCYEYDRFVAVSRSDVAAYSLDGINWTEVAMPSDHAWNSVCFGNGKFVTVSSWKRLMGAWTTDGINWTQMNKPDQASESLCYGNGKFVGVGSYGSKIAIYSSDGINWRSANLPRVGEWTSVCYRDGKFVAVASGTDKAACGKFTTKTNTVGNKTLKTALNNGVVSGVTTLTTNACNKLRQAYGSNIRIYLIKYRKSAGDYTYLDNCTTSSGGKAYDVDNSAALKTTLDEIATDLKSWIGYKEARIVN